MSQIQQIVSRSVNTVEEFSKYFVELGDTGQWLFFTFQAFLFYILIFLTLYSSKFDDDLIDTTRSFKSRILKSDTLFVLAILIFILFSRIPNIMRGVLNPDESFWIAIAKTLSYDPRFWISADGGTGGPIVPFSLLSLKLFGLPIDSGTSKIMSNVFITGTVVSVYIFLRQITNSLIARLSILPYSVLASVMSYYDLAAYNSEHVATFMIGIALIFLPRIRNKKKSIRFASLIFVGIFLGLIPFTKLQAVPIALLVGLAACYILLVDKRYRQALLLVIISIVPTIIIIIAVSLYGGMENFWTSYVLGNVSYTSRYPLPADFFGYLMRLFFELIDTPPELKYFVYVGSCLNLVALLWFFLEPKTLSRVVKEYIIFSLLITITSIYCVVAPNNSRFYHYITLFIFPISISIGIYLFVICVISRQIIEREGKIFTNKAISLVASTAFIFASSFYYFHQFFTYNLSYYPQGVAHANGIVHHDKLVAQLKEYYSPNARMSIWGWTSELYESTDFLMGTRHVTTSVIMDRVPPEKFHSINYISDLIKNKPLLFVETVAPNYFSYKERSIYGYENFPVIRDFVNTNYTFQNEIEGARIFLRNDQIKNPWLIDFPLTPTDSAIKYLGYLDNIEIHEKLVNFSGWAAVDEEVEDQEIYLSFYNENDTIIVKSYPNPRHDVVLAYGNWNLLNSGYHGYSFVSNLPANDYRLGVYIKKGNNIYYKDLNRSISID